VGWRRLCNSAPARNAGDPKKTQVTSAAQPPTDVAGFPPYAPIVGTTWVPVRCSRGWWRCRS
jgi:hypothetical protein